MRNFEESADQGSPALEVSSKRVRRTTRSDEVAPHGG